MRYPPGTVHALLDTGLVTRPTRDALQARLERDDTPAPRFFDTRAFATLRAACAVLIPQPERARPVDLAGAIDGRLARHEGNGWRYDALPSDEDAYVIGLRGLDETAGMRFGGDFVALNPVDQQRVLSAVQRGEAEGASWEAVPASRFFEELLAEAVESYYSHPLAQEEIGYVGMADVPGWRAIGLDQLEAREPRPLPDGAG